MNMLQEVRRLTKNFTSMFRKDSVTQREENGRIFEQVATGFFATIMAHSSNLVQKFLAKHKIQYKPLIRNTY